MTVQDLWRKRDGSPSARHGQGRRWRVIVAGYPATSHHTKAEAELVNARRIAAGPPAPADTTTVRELLDQWLASKRGLSPRGYSACRVAYRQVLPHWQHHLAVEVTRPQVAGWLADLQSVDLATGGTRPAAGSTRAKALQALKGAMQIAVDHGIIAANPCDHVSPGRQARRAVTTLEPGELAALAEACTGYSALIWLLGTCGLRIGEACALTVGDVDVARSRLVVRSSKTGLPREVPIPGRVLGMLNLDRDPNEPLFAGERGGKVDPHWFRPARFRPAVEEIGRGDVTPHVLRHTAASLAIRAGADVKAVQRMLGHASATMTLDTYGHLWDRGLDDVAARMDGLI